MWIRREFDWADDDRMGLGWRTTINSGLFTVRGFGIAHDLMEHFTLDGSIVDEAHAFGAMLWGRVLGGWRGWDSTYFPDVMCVDAAEFIVENGSVPFVNAAPVDDQELEKLVQGLQTRTLDELPAWLDVFGNGYDIEARGAIDVHAFCNHVRRGYRKTVRRWAHRMTPDTWADIFETIAKHPLTNEAPPSENDKLVIQISPKQCRVRISLDEYVGPYAY